ncbi:MAG: hypothetical protein H6741_29945 [Alphaproteobacteria bacterium]|nr:hypothetical protein [Alphaproteobacteria bacterium]MCB9796926.1 hypothetical protein [Alphaproteobacteria bacterium]
MTARSILLLSLVPFAFACGEKDGDDSAADDSGAEAYSCNEDGTVCYLSGEYASDLTLTADVSWVLQGPVFIGDDTNPATISIEAGTTIYGTSGELSFLVIRRNAQIDAVGTASAPIVFTSDQPEGSRNSGDWGGLIINGNAPINNCFDGSEVLPCEAEGEGSTGTYGGDDPGDSSGTLEYVRVEFAGALITSENELNGIAFQGVGSGTTVDYVQVHKNADDGVEFFGGNVGVKHVVISGVGDDSMDWTDGWRGKAQHVVLMPWSDQGDQGIEADNNGDSNEALPRATPTIANVTVLGTPSNDIGVLLREGTAGELHNIIVANFGDGCLSVDGDSALAQASSGALSIQYGWLDCQTPYFEDDGTVQAWFEAGTGNATGPSGLTHNEGAPGFMPGSGAANGGPGPSDAWFDDAAYYGAIDPNGSDWTAGWTSFPAN